MSRRHPVRIVLVVTALCATLLPVAAQEPLARAGALPLRDGGRVTTFADYANGALRLVGDTDRVFTADGTEISATRWYLDLITRHPSSFDARCLAVTPPRVRAALGLPALDADAASPHVNMTSLRTIGTRMQALRALLGDPAAARSDAVMTAVRLLKGLERCMALRASHPRPENASFEAITAWVGDARLLAGHPPPLTVPPADDADGWESYARAIGRAAREGAPEARWNPAIALLGAVLDAHRAGEAERLGAALSAYETWLEGRSLDAPFSYRVPSGWAPVSPDIAERPDYYQEIRTWGRRVASFSIGGGAGVCSAGVVHVEGGCASDDQIVDDWRTQLGMPPMGEVAAARPASADRGAVAARRSDVSVPEGVPLPRDRSLGAVVRRGDHAFVFTLVGPHDAVAAQAGAFNAWLASVRIGDAVELSRWFGPRVRLPALDPVTAWTGVAVWRDGGVQWTLSVVGTEAGARDGRRHFDDLVGAVRPFRADLTAPDRGLAWALPAGWQRFRYGRAFAGFRRDVGSGYLLAVLHCCAPVADGQLAGLGRVARERVLMPPAAAAISVVPSGEREVAGLRLRLYLDPAIQ